MKLAVVGIAIFMPLMLKGDTACFILTIAIALEFWTNKNLARSFLQAHWFVDTTTEKDRWVYEAKVKKPDTYEGLFWFSSIVYMVLLAVCFLYYASRHQLSLGCSLVIGLVCAYLNFFAYSKIMKLRDEGVLEKISAEVGENPFENGATIQLPLITVRSELK
jgi:hypothetical protein